MSARFVCALAFLIAATAAGMPVVDCADEKALQRALDEAWPGDVIRVVGRVGEKTTFTYSKSGSAGKPIVITAKPGTKAVVAGSLIPKNSRHADYVDVVGLTFDGGGSNTASCLQMVGASFRAINNVFISCKPANAILANDFPGQLVYGNVILDSNHGIYIQNTYAKNGYKTVRRNVVGRLNGCIHNCYSLHAYSQSGSNSGLDVVENFFHAAPVALIGGTNPTTKHEKFRSNVVYAGGGAQMGYKDGCAQIDDGSGNTFIRAQWGLDPLCSDADPNVIGSNIFYPDPSKGTYYSIRYRDAEKKQTSANPRDSWSGDTFLVPAGTTSIRVSAWFNPPAGSDCCKTWDLAAFRKNLALAGVKDPEAGAQTIAEPPATAYWGTDNEFEPGRGQLAILRWGAREAGSATVPLPIPAGQAFTVTRSEDMPYGEPVLSGVYDGRAATVPTTGEFQTYIVRAAPAPSSAPVTPGAPAR